jgi:[acyl-carrier-protein] S-malonyltransferase
MVVWSKTAFVFPGQGSQVVGMGRDFDAAYPTAREVFREADEQLGYSLSRLCFEGPEDQLNDTVNTQPALYVCSMAMLRALQSEFPAALPVCAAGHSLGEITALAAAGALSFVDGLRVVRERGRLMKAAGEKQPGAMAALLGLDAATAGEICAQAVGQTGRPVVVANDNCPGQIVISGDSGGLDVALELAKAAGAKRAVKLAVSIAAHSPLMEPALDDFRQALETADFHAPQVPVYFNATAGPVEDTEAMREWLGRQLISPVRWTETVQNMAAAGVERFVEIGSGDVLTGLLRRIDRSKEGIALNSVEALKALAGG